MIRLKHASFILAHNILFLMVKMKRITAVWLVMIGVMGGMTAFVRQVP